MQIDQSVYRIGLREHFEFSFDVCKMLVAAARSPVWYSSGKAWKRLSAGFIRRRLVRIARIVSASTSLDGSSLADNIKSVTSSK